MSSVKLVSEIVPGLFWLAGFVIKPNETVTEVPAGTVRGMPGLVPEIILSVRELEVLVREQVSW